MPTRASGRRASCCQARAPGRHPGEDREEVARHSVDSPVPGRGEPAQSPIHGHASKSSGDRGSQLCLDGGRLALLRSGARSLLACSDRLGDEDSADRRPCAAGADDVTSAPQPEGEAVHHSDRGSQYASTMYRQLLTAHGITLSTLRRGTAGITSVWIASSAC